MKSLFRSRLWNARELLFILLLAITVDRLAMAHGEQEREKEKAAVAAVSASTLAATSSIYPSQLLLSSCKDVGDAGQISR